MSTSARRDVCPARRSRRDPGGLRSRRRHDAKSAPCNPRWVTSIRRKWVSRRAPLKAHRDRRSYAPRRAGAQWPLLPALCLRARALSPTPELVEVQVRGQAPAPCCATPAREEASPGRLASVRPRRRRRHRAPHAQDRAHRRHRTRRTQRLRARPRRRPHAPHPARLRRRHARADRPRAPGGPMISLPRPFTSTSVPTWWMVAWASTRSRGW